MRTVSGLPVVCCAALFFGACTDLMVPSDPPSLDGTVLEWDAHVGEKPPFFFQLVQGGEICEVFVVEGSDFLRRLPDGRLEEATHSDLEVGLRVRVWLAEPIACPGQGMAQVVELFVQ